MGKEIAGLLPAQQPDQHQAWQEGRSLHLPRNRPSGRPPASRRELSDIGQSRKYQNGTQCGRTVRLVAMERGTERTGNQRTGKQKTPFLPDGKRIAGRTQVHLPDIADCHRRERSQFLVLGPGRPEVVRIHQKRKTPLRPHPAATGRHHTPWRHKQIHHTHKGRGNHTEHHIGGIAETAVRHQPLRPGAVA